MHLADNLWIVLIEGTILVGLIIAIVVKIASTIDK